MSLNRVQWVEMWKSIKKIEKIALLLRIDRREQVLKETNKIKQQIQSVIGQME